MFVFYRRIEGEKPRGMALFILRAFGNDPMSYRPNTPAYLGSGSEKRPENVERSDRPGEWSGAEFVSDLLRRGRVEVARASTAESLAAMKLATFANSSRRRRSGANAVMQIANSAFGA
jgi:hypothetical protein